jgi:pimeloyl-ACP methyl ester carboxylesterase
LKGELIFLPGMICDAASWQPQIESLNPDWTVRVASYPLLDSIGAMAEQVLATAPPRFAVAGHSMGGRVAQEIVARSPERVSGLALLGTDFRGPANEEERAKEAAVRQLALDEVRAHGFAAFAQGWARRLIAAKRRDDLALIDVIVSMTLRQGAASLEAHGLAGLNRPDYSRLLGRITCPTLLCAGDQDEARPVGPHRMMSEAIRGSTLVVLEECGHMMSLECPELVSSALGAWLDRIE